MRKTSENSYVKPHVEVVEFLDHDIICLSPGEKDTSLGNGGYLED